MFKGYYNKIFTYVVLKTSKQCNEVYILDSFI